MLQRYLSFCNGKITCHPCLAHQHIIAGIAKLSCSAVIADAEQSFAFVIEYAQISLINQPCDSVNQWLYFCALSAVLPQSFLQGYKAADKVSAVYCRNVLRLEYFQIAGGIPIIQISVKFFQLFYRRDRIRNLPNHYSSVNQLQISGGKRGQQQHSDIGG